MDLMIDIETAGNTSRASMLQLAGVYFDRMTGELGDEFCMNVDEQSCVDLGFHSDKSTREWWATQDQDILKAITENAHPVINVIQEFNDFLKRGTPVWSHATFDFVIVNNYFNSIDISGMPFRSARDIRTLVDLSGIDLSAYDWSGKTHNALDDCKFQIKYCVDALNALQRG